MNEDAFIKLKLNDSDVLILQTLFKFPKPNLLKNDPYPALIGLLNQYGKVSISPTAKNIVENIKFKVEMAQAEEAIEDLLTSVKLEYNEHNEL